MFVKTSENKAVNIENGFMLEVGESTDKTSFGIILVMPALDDVDDRIFVLSAYETEAAAITEFEEILIALSKGENLYETLESDGRKRVEFLSKISMN